VREQGGEGDSRRHIAAGVPERLSFVRENHIPRCDMRVGSTLLIVVGFAAAVQAQPEGAVPSAASAAHATPAAPAVELGAQAELQLELHRRGFSCGPIDGVRGPQTAAALRAFQRYAGLPDTGDADAVTREKLHLSAPALTHHVFTEEEISALRPVPTSWLERSQQPVLNYATALELAAERYHAHPNLVRRLNPGITDWEAVSVGTSVVVPAVDRVLVGGRAAQLIIRLEARELEVFDEAGRVIAHFPVSIARKAEKRPQGELRITSTVRDPNYTFDPEVFAESAEARELGRKLIIAPGPNNPVGRAWIGLDLPGYGIHGTPDPEKVGRTESHGCFRLANWDAVTLLEMVRIGMTVSVEP
jgi:lipoprotein-anchoring transpeptidase ErfK/SrfK